MAAPLLDLDTLTEHPSVKIDGVLYGLTPMDALSVLHLHRFQTLAPALGRLFQKRATITKAEAKETETILTELCEILLDAPPEVRAKLNPVQRLSVYAAFLELPRPSFLRRVEPTAGTRRKTTRPSQTGGPSSRASRASTAARRSTGSRRSRTRSSKPASP